MFRLLIVTLSLSGLVAYSQPSVSDEIYLADPAVLRVGKTYYLYGTVEENADQGFKVYVSSDQKRWEDKGFAMKKFQSYGEKGFWAPQVLRYQDKFFMAYVANERIAIAASESPLGPFRQDVLQPVETGVKQIDPFIFVDDDGKVYLYHVRLQNGNRLFVGEMKKDLSGMIAETVKECLNASEDWENTTKSGWPVAEGPTVLKHKGLYYLFYTANDFRNPDYAVGYATSKSPFGPWTKYSGNPIISRKDLGINGTGHGDFYQDVKGNLNYVMHTHYSNTAVRKRKTATLTVNFRKGGKDADRVVPDFRSFYFLQTK